MKRLWYAVWPTLACLVGFPLFLFALAERPMLVAKTCAAAVILLGATVLILTVRSVIHDRWRNYHG